MAKHSNFGECIADALSDGLISEQMADDLSEVWQRSMRREEGQGKSAAEANAIASRETMEAMEREAARRKRLEALTAERRTTLMEQGAAFRNGRGERDFGDFILNTLDNIGNGYGRAESVAGRQNAIIAQAHGRMEEFLFHFRRGVAQRRLNRADLKNVVKEAFGVDTGDHAAKALSRAWSDTAEWLRQRANRAGMEIGKLENWGLPQSHDRRAVQNFVDKHGLEAFRKRLFDMLDPEKMLDPEGRPMTAAQVWEDLPRVIERILTDGDIGLKPSTRSRSSMLANRRQEARYLVFKDAETWMKYAEEFSSGDAFSAAMQWVGGMAKDIAEMEVLGPNPDGMRKFLHAQAEQIAAQAELHGHELVPKRQWKNARRTITKKLRRADDIWLHHTGAVNSPDSQVLANVAGNVRNILTSAYLGSAVLSAIPGDAVFNAFARTYTGASHGQFLSAFVGQLASRKSRRDAVASGAIFESANNELISQARYAGTLSGQEWSRHVANASLAMSLLSPWTRAGRHAFIQGLMYDFGRAVQMGFDALDGPLRRTLDRYGISEADWSELAKMRTETGRLDLVNVSVEQEKLASRVLEMFHAESEFAVPSGNLRARSLLIGNSRAGTLQGELRRSASMFMSFGVTLPYLHGLRIYNQLVREGEGARGAGYMTTLLITLTLGGAMSIQAKELAAGRDPREMESQQFWMAAGLQGGGLGIWGDFFFADTNRFGGSFPVTAGGPVVQTATDLHRAVSGNISALLEGKQTTFAADLTDIGTGLVPGSNTWYLKLAYDRYIEDALQKILDPEAEAAFRRRVQSQRRDYGNEYFWAPGETAPTRAPDFESIRQD